jgi:hypothetical protein
LIWVWCKRSGVLRELWDPALVTTLSQLPCVDRAFSLGTLAVFEIKPEEGAVGGYKRHLVLEPYPYESTEGHAWAVSLVYLVVSRV